MNRYAVGMVRAGDFGGRLVVPSGWGSGIAATNTAASTCRNQVEAALEAAGRAYRLVRLETEERAVELGRIRDQGNLLGEDQVSEAERWLKGAQQLRRRLGYTEKALGDAFAELDGIRTIDGRW